MKRFLTVLVATTLTSCMAGRATVGQSASNSNGTDTAGDGNTGTGNTSSTSSSNASVQRILFVGDSFTHGRYEPVRSYNANTIQQDSNGSTQVVDENYGQTGARAELESGPWGGIPGIYAELCAEANRLCDVHIEAISATSLSANYAVAANVIAQTKWTDVVLQDLSLLPVPQSLSNSSSSNPNKFCANVVTLERGIHAAAPAAKVYLYETWARSDTAQTMTGSTSSAGFDANYMMNLALLGNAYHDGYYGAAAHDGAIAGVAPAGNAWSRAWAQGVANPNPYHGTTTLPLLWYGINSTNDPSISSPDYLHPSVYGAYLNGLVLFQTIAGIDARTFGANETAAAKLGIASSVASQLQQVAWEAVTQTSATLINQTVDPCTES